MIREAMEARLHAYLGGIARENSMVALAVGGIADHVHLLVSLSRTVSVAKAVQLLKAGSSKWVNETFPEYGRFGWPEGYGAFSIGRSQRERTVAYIHNQAEHHKRFDFAEEFRRFLAAHGIEEEEISVVPEGTPALVHDYPALGSAQNGLNDRERNDAPNHAGLLSHVPTGLLSEPHDATASDATRIGTKRFVVEQTV